MYRQIVTCPILTLSPSHTALDAPSLVFFALTGTCSLNQNYGYAFGRRHPSAHKSVGNRFGRPKVACKGCAMEGAHQKILRDHRIHWCNIQVNPAFSPGRSS